ncbi:MAG: NAD(P)/FAD-dependent oxidoreductase [Actinobacteria bacterium]|nr:NAD(P)/FAD-dependent oxidoreductase [Actinomycetota bacterium]
MDYDAIIIGAGLGGCAAGCLLVGAGRKVLILERMEKVGGRCSSQDREGFHLDLGAHAVFGCEHGAFEEACRRVGKEGQIKRHHFTGGIVRIEDALIRFDTEKLTVSGENMDTITINIGAGAQEMMKMVPNQLMSMGMGMITQMMPMVMAMAAPIVEQFDDVTIKDFVDKYVEFPKMRDILELGQFGMFGTPSWLTSTGELMRTMLGVMEYYKPGMNPMELAGFPMGGLISIPRTMCEGITDRGGEIRTNTNVGKVLVENGKTIGVELDNGEIIKAPVVISNGGLQETVADLVGEEHFAPDYVRYIRDLLPGVSAFCLRAALDTRITDIDMGLGIARGGLQDYYHELWDELRIPDAPPPTFFSVPSNMDPSLAPEGKQLVISIGAMMYDFKDDYKKMEPLILDAMDHALPGFKEHIMWYDWLNPGTYIAFGEKKASAVGLAQCVGQVGKNRPSSILPIRGLYVCGGEAGKNISGMACDMCVKSGLATGDYVLSETRAAATA